MLQTGKSIVKVKDHQGSINDMQKNRQGTMFVTASKDKTAKLFDVDDLSVHKVYVTERPVNSASLSPIYDHVSKILKIMTIQCLQLKTIFKMFRWYWVVVKKLWM